VLMEIINCVLAVVYLCCYRQKNKVVFIWETRG
jgi:hypothetical protein